MYWLSVLRPASPSFLIASNCGITELKSWMMMDAEIYGMMFSANTAMRCTAPPENMLNMSSTPWRWPVKLASNWAGSIPGSGM